MEFKEFIKKNPHFLSELKKCDTKDQMERLLKENHLDISTKELNEFLNGTRNDLLDGEDLENVSGGAVKGTAKQTWAEINAKNISEKKVLTIGEFCSTYGIDLTSEKGKQVWAYLMGTQKSPGPAAAYGGEGFWVK